MSKLIPNKTTIGKWLLDLLKTLYPKFMFECMMTFDEKFSNILHFKYKLLTGTFLGIGLYTKSYKKPEGYGLQKSWQNRLNRFHNAMKTIF